MKKWLVDTGPFVAYLDRTDSSHTDVAACLDGFSGQLMTTGAVVTETTYSEYGDWNWNDYQADIMLPRRMVRKQGDTTLELQTTNTNTYNPYVVMPVPENVK